MSKTIYMLCGLPASGKSTWAERKKYYLEARGYETEIISTDAIRGELYGDESIQGDGKLVFDTAFKRIEANLNPFSMVRCIIFDATNLHRKDREAFIQRFKKYDNPTIFLVYFNVPFKVCKNRNENRNRKVPVKVMWRMWKHRDVPELDEGFDGYQLIGA